MPRLRLTIALRLTLWYALAFAVSSALAMGLVYSTVAGVLRAKVDHELRQDLDETAAIVSRGGLPAFDEEFAREVSGPDSARVFLRLWSEDGSAMRSAGFGPPDAQARAAVSAARQGTVVRMRMMHPDGSDHGVRVGEARSAKGLVVEMGQSLEETDELLDALRGGILIVLPTMLLLGAPLGWFMARRALRGVNRVTTTAREIADGALQRRVPVGTHGDELDRLAQAFNAMLDRIEALITGMRDVTDNLAHDLRTPLARMRASAERALARGASSAEWTALPGTTTEECDRVLQILDGTLEIAEAQAGATELRLADVDLAALLAEAHDVFLTLAEDAGVALTFEAASRCVVTADRSRLQRVVANLVDNAIKFTPPGGRVCITLEDRSADVRVHVRDTGRGIPSADLPRVFERFYRGDGSRAGRGTGLGLSLARAFARAHGGDITATSTPGEGSTFTLHLRRAVR